MAEETPLDIFLPREETKQINSAQFTPAQCDPREHGGVPSADGMFGAARQVTSLAENARYAICMICIPSIM